jgi:hypothetical protein
MHGRGSVARTFALFKAKDMPSFKRAIKFLILLAYVVGLKKY